MSKMKFFAVGLAMTLASRTIAQDVPLDPETIAEIDGEIDKELARLLKPTGPPVAGWSRGGVTLAALLGASPKDKRQAVFVPDKTMAAAMVLAEDFAKVVPPGWQRDPLPDAGKVTPTHDVVAIIATGKDSMIVGSGPTRIVDAAECSVPATYTITYYRSTKAPKTPDDVQGELLRFFLERYLRRLASTEICSVVTQTGKGITLRTYTPDGRPLGALDESDAAASLIPLDTVVRRLGLKL